MKLFIFIILFFVSIFLNSSTFAQESATSSGTASRSSYELSYPGILPDHPLYFLKMIRDRVVEILISDPTKKFSFHVLQGDKRLLGGVYLYQKDSSKHELSFATISKGQNYMEQAVFDLKRAKDQGQNTFESYTKLGDSLRKHHEVLEEFSEMVKPDQKKRVDTFIKRNQGFINEVNRSKPKN